MWEWTKNLPIAIAILLLGGIFVFLGLHDTPLEAWGINFQLAEFWPRVISGSFGVILILAGVALAFFEQSRLKSTETSTARRKDKKGYKQSIEAQNFLTTVTDRGETFHQMLHGAQKLNILTVTGINILNQYYEVFEELGKKGCKVKFLFLHPTCDNSKLAYGGNQKIFENNVNRAIQALNKLKPIYRGNLELRTIDYAPPMGIIIVNKGKLQKQFAHVQLYFLRGASGNNRPVFRVASRDKWFGTFCKEFDNLWEDGKDWDTSKNTGVPPVKIKEGC